MYVNMFDARFTLDTLYDVSRYMQGFVSSQESSTNQLIGETHRVEREAKEAVYSVKNRLETEKAELANLKSQLSTARWELSRCPETNEDGSENSDYEYWSRVVDELECKVDDQEEVVARVESALEEVSSAAEGAIARCQQVISQTQQYRGTVTSKAYSVSQALRRCTDVMQDYWNIKL